MWNDSRNDTIQGFRCAIELSFNIGCIWVQKSVLGCKSGSAGATPSFRFVFCRFVHVCPVSGFRTEWGVSLTESQKPERAANRGLCGQNEPLGVNDAYFLCLLGALRNLLFQAHAEFEAVDESLSSMLPAQVIHGVNDCVYTLGRQPLQQVVQILIVLLDSLAVSTRCFTV